MQPKKVCSTVKKVQIIINMHVTMCLSNNSLNYTKQNKYQKVQERAG